MLILFIAVLIAQPHPLLQEHALRRPPLPIPTWTVSAEEHPENPCDILHYDISLEVFREIGEVAGTTKILMTSAEGTISDIRLDLRQLTADSVWDTSGALTYSSLEDSIYIELSTPISPGDTIEICINYSGTPYHEAWGGFWFHPYITYHIGVGVYTEGQCMGKCMFPCWDYQNDKATFDFHLTCPDTLYAVANGDSTGVVYNGDTATYSWSFNQPLPTYLVAFAIGEYTVLHDSTDSRIYYYVYEWDVEDALISFSNVDLMLANLENLFGEYPWNCKFSLVQTPKGDMEHTSLVSHLASAVNGFNNYDWLIAHEMTHQWWGCCVTHNVWQNIWLKEGFAVLGEALWMATYGEDAYTDYMVHHIMIPYLNSGEMFPISQPTTPAEIFGYTTYEKAACVLHMLRYVLGDEVFFETLNYYFDKHKYGLVSTEDFRDDIEFVTGEDIDWFFDTWIHDWGYPIYNNDFSWVENAGVWDVTVSVQQIQTTGPVFEMPLEFLIEGVSEDTLVTMWNNLQSQSHVYPVSFEPVSVTFDPYSHILSRNVLTGIGETVNPPPGGMGTLYLGPNPCRVSTTLFWPGAENMKLSVAVYDLAGRVVLESSLDADERNLNISALPSATYLVDVRGENGVRQVTRVLVID